MHTNGENEVLYIGFNQDQGCFACGTNSGFRIYNCDPFKETFRRDFNMGGIGVVEMLFRCNILALVGGGRNPRYPPNKVMIWDDHLNRQIGELSFKTPVKAVKLRRDRVVVVLLEQIYVYRFADLKLMDSINTYPNPLGLCALSPNSTNNVLACPQTSKGHVTVNLYDIRKTVRIKAHQREITSLVLNTEGKLLATASEQGTLIRVFETHNGGIQHELRRGVDKAFIRCMTFNPTSQFLACASDKGTIHVFRIGKKFKGTTPALLGDRSIDRSGGGSEKKGADMTVDATIATTAQGGDQSSAKNTKSALSFLGSVLPKYFSSEWSFAKFHIDSNMILVAFGSSPNTIIAVTAEGEFYKASFAKCSEKEEMEQLVYSKFVKTKEDDN